MAPSHQQQVRIITRAARRYGIAPKILWGVYGQESNFGRNEGPSSAGAVGPFQFEPATARGLGINPYKFRQAAFGAAKYLSEYRSRGRRGMLAAYNAGPQGNPNNPQTAAYIPSVLRLAKTWPGPHGSGPGGTGASGGGGGGGGGMPGVTVPGASGGIPAGSTGLLDLVKQLTATPVKPMGTGLTPPSFAAGPRTPAGYQAPQGGAVSQSKPAIDALLKAIQTPAQDTPGSSGTSIPGVAGSGGGGGGGGGGSGQLGRVSVAPGANRAGVPLQRNVIQFVREIAGIDGRPLTIGTGSNHSRLTINGTVSDHWRGEAADIPLTGRALIRAGQAALIAAGMSPKRAHRITGGGFNVGGWQVIFNTDAPGWGNHLTHLHVGHMG